MISKSAQIIEKLIQFGNSVETFTYSATSGVVVLNAAGLVHWPYVQDASGGNFRNYVHTRHIHAVQTVTKKKR